MLFWGKMIEECTTLACFVGSWSGNASSRYSSFLIMYAHVDCNFSFPGKDVLFLWWWAPAYFVKFYLDRGHSIKKNPFLMVFAKVVRARLKQLAWRYCASSLLYLFLQIIAFDDWKYWTVNSYGNTETKEMSHNLSICFIFLIKLYEYLWQHEFVFISNINSPIIT